jgi:hypothetical protein
VISTNQRGRLDLDQIPWGKIDANTSTTWPTVTWYPFTPNGIHFIFG